jgi:hypothetical protein
VRSGAAAQVRRRPVRDVFPFNYCCPREMAVAQGSVDQRSTERTDPEVHRRKPVAKLAAKPKRKYLRRGDRLSSCRAKLGALWGRD